MTQLREVGNGDAFAQSRHAEIVGHRAGGGEIFQIVIAAQRELAGVDFLLPEEQRTVAHMEAVVAIVPQHVGALSRMRAQAFVAVIEDGARFSVGDQTQFIGMILRDRAVPGHVIDIEIGDHRDGGRVGKVGDLVGRQFQHRVIAASLLAQGCNTDIAEQRHVASRLAQDVIDEPRSRALALGAGHGNGVGLGVFLEPQIGGRSDRRAACAGGCRFLTIKADAGAFDDQVESLAAQRLSCRLAGDGTNVSRWRDIEGRVVQDRECVGRMQRLQVGKRRLAFAAIAPDGDGARLSGHRHRAWRHSAVARRDRATASSTRPRSPASSASRA